MNQLAQPRQISNSLPPPTIKVCVEHEITFAFGFFAVVPSLAVWPIHPHFFPLASQIPKSVSFFEIKSP